MVGLGRIRNLGTIGRRRDCQLMRRGDVWMLDLEPVRARPTRYPGPTPFAADPTRDICHP
jgi:hypothetical protein